VEEALEEEEMLEMAETPEQDRRLAVSGVGRRFGEGVREREAVSVEEESTFVLMAVFMRKQIMLLTQLFQRSGCSWFIAEEMIGLILLVRRASKGT
jgi:hypothetical protein